MSNDPFDTRAHVADFDAISQRYVELSERTRRKYKYVEDISYGESPSERLDLVVPGDPQANAPIHMFIHGGYWRAGSRKSYSYMAEPVLAAGGIAVIVDYGLMPHFRLADIIAQVRRAARWSVVNARQYGGDPARFSASGHSAGAHLASYLAARAPHEADLPNFRPRALLLASGIYDLRPMPRSFLQPEIHMTAEETRLWSPIDALADPHVVRAFAVGAEETSPFHDQQSALASLFDAARIRKEFFKGLNHMSIVLEMGTPGSATANLLQSIVLT